MNVTFVKCTCGSGVIKIKNKREPYAREYTKHVLPCTYCKKKLAVEEAEKLEVIPFVDKIAPDFMLEVNGVTHSQLVDLIRRWRKATPGIHLFFSKIRGDVK